MSSNAAPELCSLIEAVCRSILIELGSPLPPKRYIDGLLKAVQDRLGVAPGRTDLPAEIEQVSARGGLTSVTKGISALRTSTDIGFRFGR